MIKTNDHTINKNQQKLGRLISLEEREHGLSKRRNIGQSKEGKQNPITQVVQCSMLNEKKIS